MHSGDKTDRAREVSLPVYGLSSAKLTYADYCRLPSGQRYELVEGDISMTPSPNTVHQRLSRRIEMALIALAESGGLGEVFHAPYDVVLSDNNVVQPDVLYVSRERRSIVTAANIQGAPDLVIEILSPNQEDWDRVVKRSVYARYGVPEYWLVNPTSLTVELLSRDEHDLRTLGVYGVHEVVRNVALPGLSLHVGTLFAGLEG